MLAPGQEPQQQHKPYMPAHMPEAQGEASGRQGAAEAGPDQYDVIVCTVENVMASGAGAVVRTPRCTGLLVVYKYMHAYRSIHVCVLY